MSKSIDDLAEELTIIEGWWKNSMDVIRAMAVIADEAQGNPFNNEAMLRALEDISAIAEHWEEHGW